MNPENRAIKIHIKEMAPMTAIQKIEDYKIPTPYKEILIALVNRKEGSKHWTILPRSSASTWDIGLMEED